MGQDCQVGIGVHFDKDVFGPSRYGHFSTWNEGDKTSAVKMEVGVMGQDTAVVFVGGSHGVWLEEQNREVGHAFAISSFTRKL